MTQLVRRHGFSALSAPFAAVFLAILLSAAAALAQAPPPLPASENGTQFLVFFRSQPIGREEVLVLRVAEGWIVRGTSRLGPPIDITSRVAEVNYDPQWRPKSLLVDGVVRGQDVTLKTTFNGTKASNVLAVQGAPQSKVDDVSADTIVLPNTFLGSYAALAMRLQGKIAGAELRAYIAPQAEVTIRVTGAVPEGISTPRGHDQGDALHHDVHQPAAGRRSGRQPVGGSRRPAAADEHPRAASGDGARRHRVRGIAHLGLLQSRRRERDDPQPRLQPCRHDHQAQVRQAAVPR